MSLASTDRPPFQSPTYHWWPLSWMTGHVDPWIWWHWGLTQGWAPPLHGWWLVVIAEVPVKELLAEVLLTHMGADEL